MVQYLTVHRGVIHMADSPEPNPDYEIYLKGAPEDKLDSLTLEFDRREYRDGLPLPVRRTLNFRKPLWSFDLARVQLASTREELWQSYVPLTELMAESPSTKRALDDGFGSGLDSDWSSNETNPFSHLRALAKSYEDGIPLPQAEPSENFPE